jgi:formylglycine-generating enzyme required for sulfatase activity/tRNA A-37 threonylcarbamoyl transferase component Bud32
MGEDGRLQELLSQWDRQRAEGREVSPAELCQDRPELLPELQRHIALLRQMGRLAGTDQPLGLNDLRHLPASPPQRHLPPPAAPLRPPRSAAALLEAIRASRLLQPAQQSEVEALRSRFADAKELARELLRRGWLTAFQANLLLQGRGQELLLGSYLLLERLGSGGMGAVFKAQNWKLGRIVALKLIKPERLTGEETVRRFQREIRAAAALDHPNIVRAYDADEAAGSHFFVMEYVEGIDLSRLVKQSGPLPVRQACDIIRQAALGLQHAFEKGLVHRDIKPGNLLLTKQGVVKVLDMGLARLGPGGEGEQSSTMTAEGTVMGTPDFIAPEQTLDAHAVDIRADLYSLGCTLYFLLTGQVPFPGGTLGSKLLHHQLHRAVPVEQLRPEVPAAVAAVVRRLMAKRPQERYQTPAEVALALAEVGRNPAPSVPARGEVRPVAAEAVTSVLDFRPSEETVRLAQAENRRRRKVQRRLLLSASLAGLVGTGLALALLLSFRSAPSDKSDPARPAPTLPRERAKEVTNSLGMKFVWCPPGTFLMGSPPGEVGRLGRETQHRVTLTKGFYLGAYEVTQAQWRAVMGNDPSYFQGDDRPVEQVNWYDCQDFCRKLGEQDGKRYRLPTEAEWEYACRAGSTRVYWSGNGVEELKKVGWASYDRIRGSARETKPVGSFQPNAWGLYDMHGNVFEWCQDWYNPDSAGDTTDPQGVNKGIYRVLRGGSWWVDPGQCRSAYSGWDRPDVRRYEYGCRVVLSLD